VFSEEEKNYLKSQRLARVATASSKGNPEVSPVGFEFDGKYFWIGSHSQKIFPTTSRYRNIMAGHYNVSLVIDDLLSVDPWRPRGIKVSGKAEVMEHKGIFGDGKYFRITPRSTVSWGIEPPAKGKWATAKRWR
jgi:pyridoxamine 5'-phosphate oxidase family protein